MSSPRREIRKVRFSDRMVFSRMKKDQEARAHRIGWEVRDAAGAAMVKRVREE